MSLIPQKDKVKLDAWTTKSMLSFVKMKTHKNLGSHVPLMCFFVTTFDFLGVGQQSWVHPCKVLFPKVNLLEDIWFYVLLVRSILYIQAAVFFCML